MPTIVRDKIKQPDGKDFKLLDSIDVEYEYTKEDGTSTSTSVKERLDDLSNNIASLGDIYYTEKEVDKKFAEFTEATSAEIEALFKDLK